MYEVQIWDRINMPGREIGVALLGFLPRVGDELNFQCLNGKAVSGKITRMWKLGCKREWPDNRLPQRYTVLLE